VLIESIKCIVPFTDVNECLVENGGCAELCNNTIGSFFCSCFQSGYEVTENSINCTGAVIVWNTFCLWGHSSCRWGLLSCESNAAASFHQISMNAIHHPVTAMPLAPTPMVATSVHALMGTPETDLVVHVRILLLLKIKALQCKPHPCLPMCAHCNTAYSIVGRITCPIVTCRSEVQIHNDCAVEFCVA